MSSNVRPLITRIKYTQAVSPKKKTRTLPLFLIFWTIIIIIIIVYWSFQVFLNLIRHFINFLNIIPKAVYRYVFLYKNIPAKFETSNPCNCEYFLFGFLFSLKMAATYSWFCVLNKVLCSNSYFASGRMAGRWWCERHCSEVVLACSRNHTGLNLLKPSGNFTYDQV
jgi:hypothetical protein